MNTDNVELDCSGHSDTTNDPNNVDSLDLDKADLDTMKGDNIGDTVYSKKWILKTLISLSKEEWSESFESDLCMLWDMTVEKDVVFFLKDNDFFSIAALTLDVPRNQRLMELILGIICNMCCEPAILETVANTDDLIWAVWHLSHTADTQTLLQVLRLLQIIVWDIQKNPKTKWLKRLREYSLLDARLGFTLENSTNEDLLLATVVLLNAMANTKTDGTRSLLMELIKINHLVPSLIDSFNQFFPKTKMTHSRVDLKFIENWLTLFSNIMLSHLEIFSNALRNDDIINMMEALFKILQPYVNTSNLFPLEERLALCIHNSVVMVSWLERNKHLSDLNIICVVVTIMHQLRIAIKEDSGLEAFMDLEETKDLAKYLEKYWLETLQASEENDILEMIQLCHEPVIKSLMDVAEEYSKESPDALAKLLRVQSVYLEKKSNIKIL